MCGIVALFSHRDPISNEALQRATHSLHDRGLTGSATGYRRTVASPLGTLG